MLGQSSVPNMHVCMGDDEEVGEGGEGVGRKEGREEHVLSDETACPISSGSISTSQIYATID